MKRLPPLFLTLVLALSALPAGSSVFSQTTDSQLVLSEATAPAYSQPILPGRYLIRPGEHLTVTFLQSELEPLLLVVNPEGHIVDRRLGDLSVVGKTLERVRNQLAAELSRLFTVPGFAVSVGSAYKVTIPVSGEVAVPGQYSAFTSQRVSDIIELAGGLSPQASRRHILFFAGGDTLRVDLDKAAYLSDYWSNPPLYAGLRIHVPARSDRQILVTGAVHNPRLIELLPTDNTATLLALAGGMTAIADSSHIAFRTLDREMIAATGTAIPEEAIGLFVPGKLSSIKTTVMILGAVEKPGLYDAGVTLGALLEKSRPTLQANRARITVFREPEPDAVNRQPSGRYPLTVDGENAATFALQAGDSVYVPVQVGYVIVSGEVKRPGLYPFHDGFSAQKYIEVAGGYSERSDRNRVEIVDRVAGLSHYGSDSIIAADGDEIIVHALQEQR